MIRPLSLLIAALVLPVGFAQTIENGDFSKGRAGWTGSGQVVFLKSDGTVSSTEVPDSQRVMQVILRPTQWTILKQTFHPRAADTAVSAKIEIMTSEDFAAAAESREYSDVDFKEGGGYSWTAEEWPKCDLLVRLQDTTWYYQPKSLKPYGSWKTIEVNFPNLKSRNRSLTLALPPGKGTVFFKSVQ